MKCNECDSAYLNPRPTLDSIHLAYSNYYTHKSSYTDGLKGFGLYRFLRKMLANGYINWRYGANESPSSFLGVFAAYLSPKNRRLVDTQMRHLPKAFKGAKLLDFGCGNGDFIKRASTAGWDVTGMDLDPKAVDAAKKLGLTVFHGGIETLISLDMVFDYITLSHVIEHVHRPSLLINACYEKLKPGGCLWLETPNITSQGHAIYKESWRGLEPPRHLVIFSPKSLEKLILDTGFREIINQPENPVVNAIFGSSEAIKAGENPSSEGVKWERKYSNLWKKNNRKSKLNIADREFITVKAIK